MKGFDFLTEERLGSVIFQIFLRSGPNDILVIQHTALLSLCYLQSYMSTDTDISQKNANLSASTVPLEEKRLR